MLYQHGHGYVCHCLPTLLSANLLQISRALLVRNHPEALPFVNKLFELFDDTVVGWDAARAIGQAGTVDKVLTKRNHAVIKVRFPTCDMSILVDLKYAGPSCPEVCK